MLLFYGPIVFLALFRAAIILLYASLGGHRGGDSSCSGQLAPRDRRAKRFRTGTHRMSDSPEGSPIPVRGRGAL